MRVEAQSLFSGGHCVADKARRSDDHQGEHREDCERRMSDERNSVLGRDVNHLVQRRQNQRLLRRATLFRCVDSLLPDAALQSE